MGKIEEISMDEQQQSLLNDLSKNFTGNFKDDMTYIVSKVKDHFRDLQEDEELRQRIEKVLLDAYPEEEEPILRLWTDLTDRSDDDFIQHMKELIDEGKATDAQFEMNLFINAMEADFIEYKPKPNVKYYSINDWIDLFIFTWYEPQTLELRPTKRDYSKIYNSYAEVLMAANEWQEAAEAYKQALLWNPYNAKTIFNLAGVYQLMEQYGMSFATILNGFRYAVRREDFSRGYAYLAYFYEKKDDLKTATQLYYLSLAWSDNSRAQERLAVIEEEMGYLEPALEGEALQKFKKDYRINNYPNAEMLNGLKAAASRAMALHSYETAYVYYGLYMDLVDSPEDYIVKMIRELDYRLKGNQDCE